MSESKESPKKVLPSVSTLHLKGHEPEDGLLQELNRFESRLNNEAERGKPLAFEVKVDGLPVILKTRDTSAFASILDEIDFSRTAEIEIRQYHGTSNHYHKHLIFIDKNRGAHPEAATLSGVEDRFEMRLADMKRSIEHEQLQKEHTELQRKYNVLEEYRDGLEDELEEYRAKRLHVGNLDLIEVGGMLLEGFIRRNPHALSSIPGGDALAGALLAGSPAPPTAPSPPPVQEGQASVSRRQAAQPTEDELQFLQVIRRVQERFNEGEFMQVLSIIDQLSNHPARIPATLACAGRDITER